MVLLGDGLNWKLALIRLETVLILTHNMYSVHAKQIIGTEIVLEAPDGTPNGRGSIGGLFQSVWT
jgi:hypothetical protein